MDRRKNIKLLITGGLGSGLLLTQACKSDATNETIPSSTKTGLYGRIPEEIERDKAILSQEGFNASEMAVITTLAEIICPKDKDCVGATAAGVPAFIDFIAKDIPDNKLPIQGGIMWLENEALGRFGKGFVSCSHDQQILIVEDIAWPDKALPEHSQGVKFFNKMRDLTMTGYFTSREGIKDLGYMGNVPNAWDGVPDDELKKHGFTYDNKWKDLYVKAEQRNKVAQWDDKGNLI